ncbi:hypothetical protein D0Z08_04840 [Nocardioides immobilis]|uniref:Uncharacterized protein n=2 Tax=Nocardioides immobilis TaxID=2049295 RepID=A0A417Y6T2_9ACTN|nr:hypothetical protein D0Z08_04840 [Nocardioides immobilis]
MESDASRSQADLLDWRDRRLEAYQAVSNTAFRSFDVARRMAESDPGGLFFAPERPGSEFDEAFAELRSAIDAVELISASELRFVADVLWLEASKAQGASRELADAFSTRHRALEEAKSGSPPPQDGTIAAFFHVTPDQAQERVDAAQVGWAEASQDFEKARNDWADKSRASLGLPD